MKKHEKKKKKKKKEYNGNKERTTQDHFKGTTYPHKIEQRIHTHTNKETTNTSQRATTHTKPTQQIQNIIFGVLVAVVAEIDTAHERENIIDHHELLMMTPNHWRPAGMGECCDVLVKTVQIVCHV
jgi:hypothetical protein